METVGKRIGDIPKILAGLCLLAGIGINFANVVGRYLFKAPIFWAEEAMIFLNLWAVFLAFIAVTAARAHLKMDLFLNLLPSQTAVWIERAGLALGAIVMGYLALQSWQSLKKLWAFEMKSVALEIPMVIPHAAVLIGFSVSAIAALLLLVGLRK